MKTILVTGSEGFIGRHLVGRLLAAGDRVCGIDCNVDCKRGCEEYQLENIDILNARKLNDFVCGGSFDAVVHLAALTTHEEMIRHKTKTLQINMQGTINLLEAVNEAKIGSFVYMSTGKVYGEITKLPIDETHPVRPRNILGKSKIIAENLMQFYSTDSAVQMIILRTFNIYGPRQRSQFLIPTILDQLADGRSEITLGNIEDKRDYLYVEDLVDAISMVLGKTFDEGVEIFNVGSGEAYSAGQIVALIGDILSRDIKVNVDESRFRKDECSVEYADTCKLMSLGWQANHTLKEGLEKTMAHYLGES